MELIFQKKDCSLSLLVAHDSLHLQDAIHLKLVAKYKILHTLPIQANSVISSASGGCVSFPVTLIRVMKCASRSGLQRHFDCLIVPDRPP